MTQGIKRIEQLFEIRNPKKPSVIVPFDGKLTVLESSKKLEVEITSEPEAKTYVVKEGYAIDVKKWVELEKWWVYAVKWRSKLKVKEDGVILEVGKDYVTLWVITKVKKKVAVGTSLKVKNGAHVYKGQVISSWSIDIREYSFLELLWNMKNSWEQIKN